MHGIEILLVSALIANAMGTNCSQLSNWPSSWIMGGSDASRGQFPFMVSIRNVMSYVHLCGGTIINHWHILTAAQCVEGREPSSMIVVTATKKLERRGQIYGVLSYVMHHSYNPSTLKNDIGLIKLKDSIAFSRAVRSVALPKQDKITAPGTRCIALGWGKASATSKSYTNNLQMLELKVISTTECQKYFRHVSDSYVCADAGSHKGTSTGDGGGPLLCGDKQVGVYVGGGAPGRYPSAFVNVPKYIDWIKKYAV